MDTCILTNFTFKDILDSMPYRVWVMDMDGRVVWENRLARGEDDSSSGCDCAILTANWWSQICTETAKVKAELEKAMHGNSGVIEFKRKLHTKEVWVRAKYNPVYSQDGSQVGLYGIESDVTIQKEALPRLMRLKTEAA